MPQKTFIGRLENLSKIGKFIVDAAREAGLDDEGVYAVELSVDEAATNIIEHGYGEDNPGKIVCSYKILKNGIKIVLEDKAKQFDWEGVPEPKFQGKEIQSLSLRGLGLFFIHKLMDDVQFESTPGNGNRLTLVKRK